MQLSFRGLHFKPLSWSTVKVFPDAAPTTLPPSNDHPSVSHPISISPQLYNAVLSSNVPFTLALTYATTAIIINRYNARRGNKPWPISKTKAFYWFVLAHNILLAVYSGWTFVGMLHALRVSVPPVRSGLVPVIDSLCKIHGPRGLGNAASFSPSRGVWTVTNSNIHLDSRGWPESTDVGRIWNEGLAFYGWFFYLSKFYEVLDTFIIQAKGKRSSTLQTFHHAGAMMGMWAGIRYMAQPIWMFVFFNSGIHAMMYTYYTLTALGFKVPSRVKRTLTTLQIAQFVIGASYAFCHLFVAYEIPVSYVEALSTVNSPSPTSYISPAETVAAVTASAGLASWLKKVVLRAAGTEGIAENVINNDGQRFGANAIHAAHTAPDLNARSELLPRGQVSLVHCMDTSGQVFGILFNCFYLAPLTALFVRFFIKSYVRRLEARRASISKQASHEAGTDAIRGLRRQIIEDVGDMHGPNEPVNVQSSQVERKQ